MKLVFIPVASVVALLGYGCRSDLAPLVQVAPKTERCTTRETVAENRFLLYDTSGVDLGQALNRHAAKGYRLLFSSGHMLLFEKADGAPIQEYVALTFDQSLERALNDAEARGFRLLPDTRGIMQKETGMTPGYEYRVVSSSAIPNLRTSIRTLERVASEIVGDGYRIVDLARFYYYDSITESDIEDDFVIGERPLTRGAAVTPPNERPKSIMLLAPRNRKVQQPLLQQAARGYRLVLVGEAPMLLLERAPDTHVPFEYVVVLPRGRSQTDAGRTLEAPMNAAAARGFRLRRDGVFLSRTPGVFWIPSIGIIMEKVGHDPFVPEFRVLDAFRYSTLQKELKSAFADGFTPTAMRTATNTTYIILQRLRTPCSERDGRGF